MKVLLVNKFHYRKGGSETYYFALADALRAHGHEVVFFAMQDEKNLPCETAEYFVSNASIRGGIKSKLNMLLHMTYSKEAYKNMKRLLADEHPDLVILNLVHKQITLSIIDAIREHDPRLPIFWTMHDLITVCPAYTMLDGEGNVCERCLTSGNFAPCVTHRCIKGSRLMSMLSKHEAEYIKKRRWYDEIDLYICPSQFYCDKLKNGNFTSKPIVTMRNPLPLGTTYESYTENDGYLLYFGRLSAEKGIKTLIDAVRKTGDRLLILGTGPIEAELHEYAKDDENVEFHGFQTGEPLKQYVRGARCVILPSEWYENGPYSAMEAMSMGKPLIVSHNGGLPELVDDGKNGYVYTAKDADALAECIRRMSALTSDEYRAMCEHSLALAKQRFNPDAYVEALEAYYGDTKRN